MRDTSKFPLYISSLDNFASKQFQAKRQFHDRLKLIYCTLSSKRCWIISCCCYWVNWGSKLSCSFHTFSAEHPPTSLTIWLALSWKRRMLGLLILEDARKEEKKSWACMAAGIILIGLWLLRLFLQADSSSNSVIIKYISKKELKGFSKNKHLKSTGLNSV